jgi:hypothetical protein
MTYITGAGYNYAIAEAIKASGAVVRVSPENFTMILSKNEKPLVVISERKFIVTSYQYMTSYRDFIFYTKTKLPIPLTSNVEVIKAKTIWIPM